MSRHSRITKEPNDQDVLFGRGNFTKFHPGNFHYRKLVNQSRVRFRATRSKKERANIAKLIVHEVNNMNPPGRFVKYDKGTKVWQEVSFAEAQNKTQKALREYVAILEEEELARIPAEKGSGVEEGGKCEKEDENLDNILIPSGIAGNKMEEDSVKTSLMNNNSKQSSGYEQDAQNHDPNKGKAKSSMEMQEMEEAFRHYYASGYNFAFKSQELTPPVNKRPKFSHEKKNWAEMEQVYINNTPGGMIAAKHLDQNCRVEAPLERDANYWHDVARQCSQPIYDPNAQKEKKWTGMEQTEEVSRHYNESGYPISPESLEKRWIQTPQLIHNDQSLYNPNTQGEANWVDMGYACRNDTSAGDMLERECWVEMPHPTRNAGHWHDVTYHIGQSLYNPNTQFEVNSREMEQMSNNALGDWRWRDYWAKMPHDRNANHSHYVSSRTQSLYNPNQQA